MNKNYCLPITLSSKSEILKKIEKNAHDYDFFEIWLDYVNQLDEKFIEYLLKKYEAKLIFVFRRQNLDETTLSEKQQLAILNQLHNSHSLIDLDIYDQKSLLNNSSKLNIRQIISYHNYKECPPEHELNQIISEIESYNPYILKISAFCNDKSDSIRLLKIMLEMNAKKRKHIILGMGEHGIITRLYGTLWGNELTFIPDTEDAKTAPGQITKDKFEKLVKDFDGWE